MMYSPSVAQKIARSLLEIEAVQIDPSFGFTWSSGIKSPIYCDNRKILSFPTVRKVVKNAFVNTIKSHFSQVDYIAGVATAGIAHGALVADTLDLPFVYVRSKAKGHGLKNRIEGFIKPGSKVVLIEDLFSTGGSCLSAANALIEEADAEILACGAIFTYNFPVVEHAFTKAGFPYFTLSSFNTLFSLDEVSKGISEEARQLVLDWQKAER